MRQEAVLSAVNSLLGRRVEHARDLLRELVMRDLRLRYKRSTLGIGWSLVNPLAQVLLFTFLFTKVLPLDIPNYTTFIFSGVLAWSWFSSALTSASGAIVGNRDLVRRPHFPVAVLPVVTVATNGIHYVLALPALLIVALIEGGGIGPTVLALPLIIAVQFCFTLGLAYLVAAAHVSFRDTQHIVGVIVMLGFYITPIFYQADNVPDEYRLLYDLNPMATILAEYRAVLIDGRWPSYETLTVVLLISAALLALGYAIFDRASIRFAEEL